jgi:hypothetical protein
MPAPTATNGKPRKQLSDQLDRLDGILDTLAEGLNGAVADAAREGTRLAVKDAIVEIMTNPELRALNSPAAPTPSPRSESISETASLLPTELRIGLWARLRARLAAARAAVGRATDVATGKVVSRFLTLRNGIQAVAQSTGEALRVRRVLCVAAGIGIVTGAACLIMPHTMAAVVGAVGWAASAVSIQVGKWLRRAALRVGLA